jgi:hypothetical protein
VAVADKALLYYRVIAPVRKFIKYFPTSFDWNYSFPHKILLAIPSMTEVAFSNISPHPTSEGGGSNAKGAGASL